MKREIHPQLHYEERRVFESQMQLDWLNKLFHDLQDTYDEEWCKDHLYSYGVGVEFKELTKKEFTNVKAIVGMNLKEGLGQLKKDSSTYAVKMNKMVIIGEMEEKDDWSDEVKTKKVDINIIFKWGVPDTCEIVYETEEVVMDDEVIERDGVRYRQTVKKSLKCNKPMLEAVFNAQADA